MVSGGQTGVDRAALDAALQCGAEAGGWCPEGRSASDGVIPARYPVKELPGARYRQRNRQNVLDSDGTAILYWGFPIGGTELTLSLCIKEKKPYVLIDAEELSIERAAKKITGFISLRSVSVLNVAGPGADREPRAYDYTLAVVLSVLERIKKSYALAE